MFMTLAEGTSGVKFPQGQNLKIFPKIGNARYAALLKRRSSPWLEKGQHWRKDAKWPHAPLKNFSPKYPFNAEAIDGLPLQKMGIFILGYSL
jgi:hypothetical protein